jgi:large subunit ribosomal protein L1
MDLKEELKHSLVELRKNKERKFKQSVDLIINLQKFDVKKNAVNIFVSIPYKIKDKKICGFFESRNKKMDTILKEEFKGYSDKKKIKQIIKKYDFFMAQASLMPSVAATFGRVLGPAGKMPSPQLGILVNVTDKEVDDLLSKINKSVRIRTKDASVKLSIGKEEMSDEEIAENILSVYNALLKVLPRNKENVKNIEIKFTMTKPIKIKLK